jgi:hypothetical protein
VHNVSVYLEEGNLDVRVLASLFGEDFDADIVVFVRGTTVIVAINLAVEDDGRRSGSERFARHLQFFRRDRLKSFTGANRSGTIVTNRQNQRYRTACSEDDSTK